VNSKTKFVKLVVVIMLPPLPRCLLLPTTAWSTSSLNMFSSAILWSWQWSWSLKLVLNVHVLKVSLSKHQFGNLVIMLTTASSLPPPPHHYYMSTCVTQHGFELPSGIPNQQNQLLCKTSTLAPTGLPKHIHFISLLLVPIPIKALSGQFPTTTAADFTSSEESR